MRSAPPTQLTNTSSRHTPLLQANRAWSPFDGLPGYRVLRLLPTRGPCRELLAMREGPSGFRRLCTIRLARTDDPCAGRALATEAAILARLHYPSILPAYDFFVVDGWMALVLAYDGALTIDKLLVRADGSQPNLDTKSVLFIAHEIFDALAYAHGKKGPADRPLVHGDVHPANILLRAHGHVVLRGFRGSEPIPTQMQAESRIDPGPYGAPELERGAPATPASDCYGAAAILWELLVRLPLRRNEPPSMLRSRPNLPPDVAAVLDVCLAPDPNQRRVHAATVAATVRGAVDLHQGRDGLERLFEKILPRSAAFATSSHASGPRSGSIPEGWLRKSISSIDQTNHAEESRNAAVRAARFDEETPTLPSRVGLDSKPPAHGIDERDTIDESAKASVCEASSAAGVRDTLIDEEPEESVPFSLFPAPERSGQGRQELRVEPRSHPPVATDFERQDLGSFWERDQAFRAAAAAALVLLMTASWMVGRYLVGPAWHSLFEALEADPAPAGVTPMQAGKNDYVVKAHGAISATAAVRTITYPSATVSAPTPPTAWSVDSAGTTTSPPAPAFPVLFHQSALRIEGPPHGVVFVNGLRVGRTGEWMLTRGCGLRFIRLGSEPQQGKRGFRWLTRGQSARLPCGGSLSTPATP